MLSVLNQRSFYHNSCEDSVYIEESDESILGCICDGCSSGKNSHFASQAICYAVRNLGTVEVTSDLSIEYVRQTLRRLMTILSLSLDYMLSTMMIFSYNKPKKILKLRIFGDGCYFVEDKCSGVLEKYTIDQNNIPDYIGYHLNDIEPVFDNYLKLYPEKIIQETKKFIITSDGIDSIVRNPIHGNFTVNPNDLLSPPRSKNYLERMWNLLKRDHYILNDDLSIISYAS